MTRLRRSALWSLLAGALLLAIAGFSQHTRKTTTVSTTELPQGQSAGQAPTLTPAPLAARSLPRREPSAEPRPARGPVWRTGDVLEYALAQEQTISIRAASPVLRGIDPSPAGSRTDPTSVVHTDFEATLRVHVLAASPSGALLSLRLDAARGQLLVDGAPAPDATLGDGFGPDAEVSVRIDADGFLDALLVPETLSTAARLRWRDVACLLQVAPPSEPARQVWTREESDATGTYTADYALTESDKGLDLHRRKHGYTHLHGASIEGTSLASVEGEARIRLEPHLSGLTMTETTTLAPETTGMAITAVAQARLRLTALHGRTDRGSLESDATPLPAPKLEEVRLSDPVRGVGQLGSPSATQAQEAVSSELEALERLLADGQARSVAEFERMRALVELLRLDEGVAGPVIARLGRPPVSGDLAAVLCGALAGAGTSACQQGLLASVLDRSLDTSTRKIALSALAQVEAPLGAWDGALASMREEGGELGAMATLLLGAIADHVAKQDPDRADGIRTILLGDLARGGATAEARILVLDALGNMPHRRMPEPVAEALAAPEAGVRAAAVRALARTRDATARDALLSAVRSDADEGVRTEAVRLLADADRPYGVEALSHVAITDPSEEVRAAGVEALGRRLPDPGARDALRRIARDSDSPTTREAAERELTKDA